MKLRDIWYAVLGALPAYGAYNSLKNFGELWTGLLAGLALAAILFGMSKFTELAIRKFRGNQQTARSETKQDLVAGSDAPTQKGVFAAVKRWRKSDQIIGVLVVWALLLVGLVSLIERPKSPDKPSKKDAIVQATPATPSWADPLQGVGPRASTTIDQADAQSQYDLGMIYLRGSVVTQNFKQAAILFQKAAELGHADAQDALGTLYLMGSGVPQDYVEAHKWFNLAAANDAKGAKEGRLVVEQRMTKEQIAEAQRRASEWVKTHK